jgi:hypothetical protein
MAFHWEAMDEFPGKMAVFPVNGGEFKEIAGFC